jgi:general secretion pathway protein K
VASSAGAVAERGFVLAVTLWLLAAIAVAVAALTLWALSEVADAALERERTDDELAIFSTRESLLYLASTRALTLAGLPVERMGDEEHALRMLDDMGGLRRDPRGGELALDGTPYHGLGGIRFAIQDEAGLFSVAWPSDASIDGFLAARGVRSRRIPQLRDALLDYIDADDLRRLNGAERREYERERLPPPPNRRLLLPRELFSVMGWSQLEEGETIHEDELTAFYLGAVNLNTAPASLLPLWLQDCPRTCEAFLERRAVAPYRSGAEVEAVHGIQLPGDEAVNYRFLADEILRMTFWGNSGAAWRMHVRLTPLANGRGPWTVLAAYPVSRPSDDAIQDPGSDLLADLPQRER